MRSLFITGLLLTAPLSLCAEQAPQTTQQHQATVVQAEQIKSWYDQKAPMIVLDARSEGYFDGRLLPGTKWLPADASEADIVAAVPAKDSMIVVYCLNTECPASGWLVNKLISMGYTNVYEYPSGIEDWVSKGYPIDQASK